jgi:hypothetical protein
MRTFKTMADDFEKEYRLKTHPSGIDREQQVECEYWNLVNGKYGTLL